MMKQELSYWLMITKKKTTSITTVGLSTITKTRLYNFDPLKPHFNAVKLGLQGYTLFFLFLL